MLNMSCQAFAPAMAPHPPTERPWDARDEETPGASRVWQLRSAWPLIVRAVLELGPVTLRAGDGLCQVEHRTHPRPPGSAERADAARATAAWSFDTSAWAFGTATQERLQDGRVRRSFAFFDGSGRAVLEMELAAAIPPADFHDIVRRLEPGTGAADAWDGWSCVHWPAPPSQPQARKLPRWLPSDGRAADVLQSLADEGLAQPLAGDALLDILQHARLSNLPMSARFACPGQQFDWSGQLHRLDGRAGVPGTHGLAPGAPDQPAQRSTRLSLDPAVDRFPPHASA